MRSSGGKKKKGARLLSLNYRFFVTYPPQNMKYHEISQSNRRNPTLYRGMVGLLLFLL